MWARWLARHGPRSTAGLRLLLAGVAAALVLLDTVVAWARPGGGQSYSGGGYSSGGGGGGGDSDGGGAEVVYFLVRLIIEVPEVGVPVTVVVIAIWVGSRYAKRSRGNETFVYTVPQVAIARVELEKITAFDPEFSEILFDDFVFRLYAQAQEARGDPARMAELAPYLAEPVRTALAGRPPTGVPISGVCIGALVVESLQLPGPPPAVLGTAPPPAPAMVTVALDIEANMTAGPPADQTTYYVSDHWVLQRAADVVTKPTTGTHRFTCPSCGAAFRSSDGQTCEYCNQVVANGRFDWQVVFTRLVHQRKVAPALTGTVEEHGNELRTFRHAQLDARWNALVTEDPGAVGYRERAEQIYTHLNRAWSEMDLAIARPYVSDGLFDYLRYWIEAYRRQGLRNALDDMQLLKSERARLIRDKHFDALTIRIFATGLDYTVNEAGKVVGGSRSRPREYTEYWTLIRGRNVRGGAWTEPTCRNCGAPLAISMAGTCDSCHAHITSGEFDWVLSKIEQDDSYRG